MFSGIQVRMVSKTRKLLRKESSTRLLDLTLTMGNANLNMHDLLYNHELKVHFPSDYSSFINKKFSAFLPQHEA